MVIDASNTIDEERVLNFMNVLTNNAEHDIRNLNGVISLIMHKVQ